MSEINVNYQDTIDKAVRLENVAKDIKGVCSGELSSLGSFCNGVWKGDASLAYQKKMGQIQSRINKKANNLQKTANSLEEAARRYKRIEDMAMSIFSK